MSIDQPDTLQTIQSDEFSDQYIGVDIGPTSVAAINEYINNSKTVFWNGPVGIFEQKAYSNGTFDIAKSLAESSAVTIVGGGDSIAALNESGYSESVDHISTGGGASLEFLEGKVLPGIAVLS